MYRSSLPASTERKDRTIYSKCASCGEPSSQGDRIMDREQVRRWESQCIQEQAPACTAACPVHVDARKLVECVSHEDFKGGLATFANAVPLPLILAHICDHPCQSQCRRSDAGDAIEISALERACAKFGAPATAVQPHTSKTQK